MELRDIDLNLLLVFDAMLRERSVSAARDDQRTRTVVLPAVAAGSDHRVPALGGTAPRLTCP